MRQLIRAVTVVLLVGGWTLAGSAVHVVRTPNHVVLAPKLRLSPYDTYVDTRQWTLADDQKHPSVVAGLLHEGHGDLLIHTMPTGVADPQATLEAIAIAPPVPSDEGMSTGAGTLMKNAEGQVKTVVDLAKTHVGKL